MIKQKKVGSSETIRKTTFNFIAFLKASKILIPQKKIISKNFLEWFIGFSEGHGSFIYSEKTNRCFFIINQKEEKLLNFCRQNLGFGKVSNYSSYSRFIVTKKSHIELLIMLFNGNLLLLKSNNRFNSMKKGFYSKTPLFNETLNNGKFNLNRDLFPFNENAWLSGFTDAEGCFNVLKIVDVRYTLGWRFRLRFILDQKGERWLFEKLKETFKGGGISNLYALKEMYRFTITSKTTLESVFAYFKAFPLKSKKKVCFNRFFSLLWYMKNKSILPWEGKVLKRVETFFKNINKS